MSVENSQCPHGVWLYEFCEDCMTDNLLYDVCHINTEALKKYEEYVINRYLYETSVKDILKKKRIMKNIFDTAREPLANLARRKK